MVLLEFQISPRADGDSVSALVAQAIDIVDRSGLPYQLTPMGTILEGEWDETFAVVKACFDQLRSSGCTRIGVNLNAYFSDRGRLFQSDRSRHFA